jgi:hypothetical protein
MWDGRRLAPLRAAMLTAAELGVDQDEAAPAEAAASRDGGRPTAREEVDEVGALQGRPAR